VKIAGAAAPNPIQGSPLCVYKNEEQFLTDLDSDSLWNKFEEYTNGNSTKHTAKCRILYAKRYLYVLRESNAQDLLLLSGEKRIHVMKALAALSKYAGCYDRWKHIREKYQLKWSNDDSLQIFRRITNPDKTYNSMIVWLKDTVSKMPTSCGNILLYNTLTGLRPEEACKSLSLIHEDLDDYVNKQLYILEHYKYPEIFIRRTKKAFISIITNQILELAKQSSVCSYNSLRLAVRRKALDMNMSYCRKIFATFLRNEGIEQEIIDLLQGRTPKSVFVRHYYKPDCKTLERVSGRLNKLYQIVTS
jgi:hypothetical protein